MNAHTSRRLALVAAVALAAIAVLALVAWLVFRPRGAQISDAAMRNVGPLAVGVANQPAAPQVGTNRMLVRVETGTGEPAQDIDLNAVVFMPAMGAMPYMESRPRFRALRPGVWEGEYALAMGGSWEVDLRLGFHGREPARAGLRLTVGTPGFAWVTTEDALQVGGGTSAMSESTGVSIPMGEPVVLSAQRRQEIGVTTEVVQRRPLEHVRRVPGRVAYDETRLADITARTGGYVRELFANFTGDRVVRGGTLLTLYAPEVYAAQREFVAALASRDELPPGPARQRAEQLVDAARQRLLLWDLPGPFVAELERTRRARETVPVLSMVSGVVIEKTVVEGAAVMPGQMLYRLAPLDPIWVVADVFQYELPLLRLGQPASVSIPGSAARARAGRIAYISPSLSGDTRTAQVRLEVRNGDVALRPEMFVEVELRIPLGTRVAVPAPAVLYSGERRIVFVDAGGGKLTPREVTLGPQAGDYFPVERGLVDGETVVTSGNFLVAAESRLRSATRRF